MKILFDARWILVENRFDGVSRYSLELAKAMADRDDLEVAWLVYDRRQADKLPAGEIVWANNPGDAFREFFSLARTVNRSGYDLLYSPFFTVGTLGKKFRLVLTIHDMIYFTHRTPPQWLPWHIRLGWRLFHLTYWPMRWQLNKADIVATVSETARQELLDKRATKRQVVTVPNAVSDDFRPSQASDDRSGESSGRHASNDIVYMGAFTPYKNVECLIDALEFLPDITLHLCGKLPPARRPEIEQYIAERGVTDRVILYDGVTDEEYKSILSKSRCAVSASRLEGFGLPLIEAQQAGVPFVAADTPIFHEVGQASVLYFDPDNPKQCAERITQLADATTNQDYIARGAQNAARYTWSSSARIAATICKNLRDISLD